MASNLNNSLKRKHLVMKTVEKRAGLALKVSLLGAVILALMAGCLNPTSFNPDNLPTVTVAGEISIDNINSAELNIRNHTRTVDVTKVDIYQSRKEKVYSEDEGGYSMVNVDPRLDARISGAPTAGTQDSVLVRPTGTNVTSSITVEGYTIKIWYKKAQNFPDELDGQFTDLQNLNPDNPLKVEIDELPRGRCVIHVYRNYDGEIAIDVDGVVDDPDYNDHRNDDDFITNVKSQTKIDLSGLEIAVDLPPVMIGEQPIKIEFSDELLDAVNEAYGKLALSIDKVATSINDLGDNLVLAIESSMAFAKDTGLLVVMNWSSKPVQVEVPVPDSTITHFIGPVSTGDLDGKLLSTNGGKTYRITIKSESGTIQKNMYVFNQKVSYLHVYVNKSGNLDSAILESPAKPEDAEPQYATLRIRNHTSSEIPNITFLKKIGVGSDVDYDVSKSFVVQKVGPGIETQYSSVMSEKVEEGNYVVYGTLADGSIVFDYLDFYLLADDVAYQTGDNLLEIKSVIPPPPPKTTYTVTPNGGPPANDTEDAYTTTKLTITFSSPVTGNPAFTPVSMSSGYGSLQRIDDSTYEVAITNPVYEAATFKITGDANIDDTEHGVQIYKKNPPSEPPFIPVTDVVVTNGMSFAKGTTKTIQWEVVSPDATNRANLYWTLGEFDFNVYFGYIGLGPSGKDYDDSQGRLTVKDNREVVWIAVYVPNGKAPGTRSPSLNTIEAAGVDIKGLAWTVTYQGLRFDKDKDFVKVFKFLKQ